MTARGAAALLGAVLLLTGCSAPESGIHDTHGSNDVHVNADPAPASPTWDEHSAQDATNTAFAAMTAYIDTDPGWFDRLRPHLTAEAQPLYSYTDPAEIEPTRLTVSSPARLEAVENGTPFLARVGVGTNAGTYTVELAREGAEYPWLVTRFVLPDEESR